MENIYFREKYLSKIRGFYHDADLIKVITGIRRSGKSCLMQMIKTELMNSGIPEKNILYFNLDKREYRFIKTDEQLDQYIEKISSGIDGKKYLFIDEIQNVKGFETVINGYREEGDYSIFITGSN
ncbi:MAG: AAA family ATPase, partial [Candidatus Enterosoma sp.]|nr:AAA family ATPase [Candidatus Enterosoma sp.]